MPGLLLTWFHTVSSCDVVKSDPSMNVWVCTLNYSAMRALTDGQTNRQTDRTDFIHLIAVAGGNKQISWLTKGYPIVML